MATSTGATKSNDAKVPPSALADSAAGAQAFAAYYFDLVNGAFQGQSVRILDGTFRSSCVTCANFSMNIGKLQASGLRVARPPYDVSLYTELPESTARTRAFSAVLVHRRSSVVRRDGGVQRVDPEERALIEIAVARTGRRWIVEDIAKANVTAK